MRGFGGRSIRPTRRHKNLYKARRQTHRAYPKSTGENKIPGQGLGRNAAQTARPTSTLQAMLGESTGINTSPKPLGRLQNSDETPSPHVSFKFAIREARLSRAPRP